MYNSYAFQITHKEHGVESSNLKTPFFSKPFIRMLKIVANSSNSDLTSSSPYRMLMNRFKKGLVASEREREQETETKRDCLHKHT